MQVEKQTTTHILMVRPAHFGYNEETAASNTFQTNDQQFSRSEAGALAVREFDALVSRLREAGVQVHVWDDDPVPPKTDAVFPNNWVTFHADGTVVTYPMLSEVRRLERDEDILSKLAETFEIRERIQLESYEVEGRFLEGTGSMILDREHKLAYACLSPRTDPGLLAEFCDRMGYEPVLFRSVDQNGQDIYHTNVMMAMGETFVVICLESVPEEEDRQKLLHHFGETGKEVVEISFDQVKRFAGNMLQVQSERAKSILVMSEQAYRSLTPDQLRRLEGHTSILYSSIETIESLGGGSVRCMMAEIFLPERQKTGNSRY